MMPLNVMNCTSKEDICGISVVKKLGEPARRLRRMLIDVHVNVKILRWLLWIYASAVVGRTLTKRVLVSRDFIDESARTSEKQMETLNYFQHILSYSYGYDVMGKNIWASRKNTAFKNIFKLEGLLNP